MKIKLATALVLISSIFNFAYADSIGAGKDKSQICLACHGPNGISTNPSYPNLAGQKYEYLKKQLIAYKAGKRIDPMMQPMVATLTEADISNIAAYYASLDIASSRATLVKNQ